MDSLASRLRRKGEKAHIELSSSSCPFCLGRLDKTESHTCRFHSWAALFYFCFLLFLKYFSRAQALYWQPKKVEWTRRSAEKRRLLIGVIEIVIDSLMLSIAHSCINDMCPLFLITSHRLDISRDALGCVALMRCCVRETLKLLKTSASTIFKKFHSKSFIVLILKPIQHLAK